MPRPDQAPWTSPGHLMRHFRLHRDEFRFREVAQYDASARATIRVGIRFKFRDGNTGLTSTGYFDRRNNRLTVLDDAETRIVTHFKPDDGEAYVRSLDESDYQRNARMAMPTSDRVSRSREILDERIQARVHTNRYALFFVAGEGRYLPAPGWNDIEEASGFVLLPTGRVFAFWLGWDSVQKGPDLIEWEEETPQDGWMESPEYRNARAALGLPAA